MKKDNKENSKFNKKRVVEFLKKIKNRILKFRIKVN